MRPFLLAFCLLPILTLPAPADPTPAPSPRTSSLRPDILYTHKGEFVQVSPMRPLTLNAHVEQFQYDPLGLEIAYVGSETEGENTVHFVKTIDARTGHELSHFAFTAPSDSQNTALMLQGWSVSGKYLLLQRFSPDPNEPQTSVSEFLRWNLSTSPPTMKTITPQVALPAEQQSADLAGSADCYPSPDGRWVLFTQSIHTQAADGKPGPNENTYLLYDPEHDIFLPLTLPPKTLLAFWADDNHLKILQHDDSNRTVKRFDVVTGQISPLPDDTPPNPPAVSKQYPDLSLDTEARDIDAHTRSGEYAQCYVVWIRRTPFGKMPLGAAAAGVMPEEQASDGSRSDAQSFPQAVWSPTGKQVAFIANGDLCVSNLATAADLLPHEKMAVGLKLSCEEEQQLAMSNLKQIGLALLQYSQDYDEHYPPTEDIEKTIYPYLKTSDVFSVGSTHWVYHGASNVSLASIDNPAETVQATMDLPCAHLVLYFDGHVKAFPKQEAAP